jgi:hypothetical protein
MHGQSNFNRLAHRSNAALRHYHPDADAHVSAIEAGHLARLDREMENSDEKPDPCRFRRPEFVSCCCATRERCGLPQWQHGRRRLAGHTDAALRRLLRGSVYRSTGRQRSNPQLRRMHEGRVIPGLHAVPRSGDVCCLTSHCFRKWDFSEVWISETANRGPSIRPCPSGADDRVVNHQDNDRADHRYDDAVDVKPCDWCCSDK